MNPYDQDKDRFFDRPNDPSKIDKWVVLFVVLLVVFFLILGLWGARPSRSTRDLREDSPPAGTDGPLDN